MAPILGQLAEEFDGKAKLVKVDIDVDGNKDLAVKYGVLSVPTLILFSNGEVKETMVGVTSKSKLKQKLEEA
jgi:thioredoxin 1